MLTDKELSKYVTPQEDVIYHEYINRYQRASVILNDASAYLSITEPCTGETVYFDDILTDEQHTALVKMLEEFIECETAKAENALARNKIERLRKELEK